MTGNHDWSFNFRRELTTHMNIVVLDGRVLNPGDLSWDGLQVLGNCTIYDRTAPEQVLERAMEADVLVTNKALLTREVVESLPKLKYIAVTATGYNVVDTDAARERDICVSNVPIYGTRSVAQMVFAHVLNLYHRVGDHAARVAQGCWMESEDWCFWDYPLNDLEGATLGVIGFGRIGRAVADLGRAFGMSVLATTRTGASVAGYEAEFVSADDVFRRSDVISLNCPLTPETERIADARRIGLMRKTAFLVNTSRGPLVDEPALTAALNSGQIAGAGLDVVCVEPPVEDNPLFHATNCYVTPHIAWATAAARGRLLQTTVDNVASFVDGTPQNVVN